MERENDFSAADEDFDSDLADDLSESTAASIWDDLLSKCGGKPDDKTNSSPRPETGSQDSGLGQLLRPPSSPDSTGTSSPVESGTRPGGSKPAEDQGNGPDVTPPVSGGSRPSDSGTPGTPNDIGAGDRPVRRPPAGDNGIPGGDRPQEPPKPRELTEKEYNELANEIIGKGEIPDRLKEALKNGIGNPGIDINKLNELLKDKGFKLELKPLNTGLQLNLTQDGQTIDSEVAKTDAARRAALRLSLQMTRPSRPR